MATSSPSSVARSARSAAGREFTVYDGIPAVTDEAAVNILRRIELDQQRGEAIHWGICPTGGGRIVGTCGYYRGFDDHVGEIGYVLGERSRGRGFMTESVRLIVAFGFDVMKLSKVVAYTDPGNVPSIAVLRRSGFTEEANEVPRMTFSIDHEEGASS